MRIQPLFGLLFFCLSLKGSSFLSFSSAYPLPSLAMGMAAADLNHDGKLDVVVGDDSDVISVFLGDGKGGLTSRIRYPALGRQVVCWRATRPGVGRWLCGARSAPAAGESSGSC